MEIAIEAREVDQPGILYARGFLLVPCDTSPPDSLRGWEKHTISGYDVYVDPRVNVEKVAVGGREAILVGDAFDPYAGVYSGVCRYLVQGDVFERLDTVAGRFVLLVASADGVDVFHDAMGSRSIYYAKKGGVVASHAALVAEVMGAGLREWVIPYITAKNYVRMDVKYLPGLDSPFESVRQLTPNTYLSLPGMEVRRYWPRTELERASREEAVGSLVQYLGGLRIFLEGRGIKPVLGMSGGRDSRGLLSALVPLQPSLFTFVRSKDGKSDRSTDSLIAAQLASTTGLDLEIVKIPAPTPLNHLVDGFAVAYRRNTGYVRGSGTLGWVRKVQGRYGLDARFIRGFGGEVMRGFYNRIDEIDASALAMKYGVNPDALYTKRAFEEFIRVAGWTKEALMNYALNDLFYWEHRMGVWGASSLAESDMSVATIPGYNSRKLFSTFMGLPSELRATSELFDEAVRLFSPCLAGIPYES